MSLEFIENFEMKEEYKTQLVLLLEKANEEGLINIHDSNGNTYEVDWFYCGYDSTINIQIKEIKYHTWEQNDTNRDCEHQNNQRIV